MIKIVHWEIDQAEVDDLPESVSRRLSDCCQWSSVWTKRDEEDVRVLASPAMPNFSETCERIKDVARNVRSARRFDVTNQYDLVIANALVDYDYAYCVQLGAAHVDKDMPKSTTPVRLVAIPRKYSEYQMARYASGLHWSRKVT